MTPPVKQSLEAGFSLIELLIATVIFTIVLGITAGITANVQSAYTQQRVKSEALNDANAALDMITRLIRNSGNNPNGIPGLQPIDPGSPSGGTYNTVHIRSDWRGATMSSMPDGDTNDPWEDVTFSVSNGQLMKQEASDASAVPFLDNVIYIQFLYYDSNNSLLTSPETVLDQIARVDVTIVTNGNGLPTTTFTSTAFVRAR